MVSLSLSLPYLALFCLGVAAQDATTTYWQPAPPTNTPCSPLELVIARGTGEPGEYGVIVGDPLVNLTQKAIPEISAYPVNYPANWTLGVSLAIGINDTVTHLVEQSAKCPDQQYVLVGYSQGAAVTHSAVTDSRLSSTFLEDKVIAFIAYGDPYNKGTGSPGALSALPDPLQTRLKENCECGDSICSNGTSFNVHVLSYVQPERGYHNVTVDYIKKAYDTNGAQGNQIFTSIDPSNNCTLQYCTNTTLAGAPPHTSGPLGECAANGTTPGNTTTSVGTSAPPASTGTGSPVPPGNSTSPSGTGAGTGSSTSPSAPISTGGSTGTGTGYPPPPANSTAPPGTGTAYTHSTASHATSVSSGSAPLPTGSVTLPTGSASLPAGYPTIALPSLSLPALSLPPLSLPSIAWPVIPKASSSKAYRA